MGVGMGLEEEAGRRLVALRRAACALGVEELLHLWSRLLSLLVAALAARAGPKAWGGAVEACASRLGVEQGE